MKIKYHFNTFILTIFLLPAALISAAPAHSNDLTKRKSGLWETKTTVMGMTSSVQECIDHDTDNLLAQPDNKMTADCSVADIDHQSGAIVLHRVCKIANNPVTIDARFSGDFNAAYSGKITVHFDQPVGGIRETETQIDSKWISPCPSDRKPGSALATLSSGEVIDLNDPKVKALIELMQKQK